MSDTQKCYTDKVSSKYEKTAFFSLSYREWNKLKRKVEKEFNNEYGSYEECRFYVLPGMLDFECHCALNRKRK